MAINDLIDLLINENKESPLFPKELRCDFCHAENPTWSYPCKSFSIPLIDSIDEWAACDQCHRWIEAGERDKIEQAALFPFQPVHPALTHYMRQLHDGFFKNRTGPAVSIAKEKSIV